MIIDQFLNSISKIVKNHNDNNLINVIANVYSKKTKVYKLNKKNIIKKTYQQIKLFRLCKFLNYIKNSKKKLEFYYMF